MPDRETPGDSTAAPARRPPRERPSTAELVRVRDRDPEALNLFFDRYFDHIYSVVYRLVGNTAAAEDVTQDVFYKVHRAAHQLDPERDPAPWLVAIAYNACRDYWRSAAHRMSRKSDPIDEPEYAHRLPRAADDPEQALLRRERRDRVQDAINRLPETFRSAVLLHDYEGLSHDDIAEMMGINPAAARKRYSRALKALGDLLKELKS